MFSILSLNKHDIPQFWVDFVGLAHQVVVFVVGEDDVRALFAHLEADLLPVHAHLEARDKALGFFRQLRQKRPP